MEYNKNKRLYLEGAGVSSIRLASIEFAFDEALHVGFFAGLQSDGGSLPTGDRLLAQNAD